jgi:hypothetical protein
MTGNPFPASVMFCPSAAADSLRRRHPPAARAPDQVKKGALYEMGSNPGLNPGLNQGSIKGPEKEVYNPGEQIFYMFKLGLSNR